MRTFYLRIGVYAIEKKDKNSFYAMICFSSLAYMRFDFFLMEKKIIKTKI